MIIAYSRNSRGAVFAYQFQLPAIFLQDYKPAEDKLQTPPFHYVMSLWGWVSGCGFGITRTHISTPMTSESAAFVPSESNEALRRSWIQRT